jgi:hypothetical protein
MATAQGHAHEHHAAPSRPTGHPDPRPGITAENVKDLRKKYPWSADVYERVIQIPQLLDSIACYCGCGHRSLLECFEDGHGYGCPGCREAAKLAHRLNGERKSLEEIRAAVDAEFQ